ncbi:ABC-three component system protein [Chromobacterium subtsugae]|uniref:ABC-three component system protein n=1 Tax=Chromobacterium subtsugae TaxID=251747 RepID=UPI000AADB497|nr:ABC-three component system protein [Chromobacterium subtsugae]
MEYLDDVAQENAHGVKLIQSKSAITANPVANRAKPLWKTLSNWITLAASGDCDPDRTLFEIYVSRPVTGSFVTAFAAASTPEAARSAVLQARTELLGVAPDFAKRSMIATEIAPYVENFFSADADLVARVIQNFSLTCGSGNPHADIETTLKSHPISQSKIRDIADHLCGVVKRRVDELLAEGAPAIIERDEFHAWYGAYVRKIDRETVLLSRARAPCEEESKGHLPRVFVQQLDIIGMTFEDKLEAVSDYLMAAADRTDWAIRGEVDASSFEDLDKTLQRNWKNKRLTCKIDYGNKPKDEQGQALYAQCMQIDASLQAMAPPEHFIPGCFHRLADDLSVGWHPDYMHQLRSKRVA